MMRQRNEFAMLFRRVDASRHEAVW
jgi:hypothetical protein